MLAKIACSYVEDGRYKSTYFSDYLNKEVEYLAIKNDGDNILKRETDPDKLLFRGSTLAEAMGIKTETFREQFRRVRYRNFYYASEFLAKTQRSYGLVPKRTKFVTQKGAEDVKELIRGNADTVINPSQIICSYYEEGRKRHTIYSNFFGHVVPYFVAERDSKKELLYRLFIVASLDNKHKVTYSKIAKQYGSEIEGLYTATGYRDKASKQVVGHLASGMYFVTEGAINKIRELAGVVLPDDEVEEVSDDEELECPEPLTKPITPPPPSAFFPPNPTSAELPPFARPTPIPQADFQRTLRAPEVKNLPCLIIYTGNPYHPKQIVPLCLLKK